MRMEFPNSKSFMNDWLVPGGPAAALRLPAECTFELIKGLRRHAAYRALLDDMAGESSAVSGEKP